MKLNTFSNISLPISEDFFKKVFQTSLEELSFNKEHQSSINNEQLEVNLILTNDTEIQELNKTWRDKDKTTDVLSFPYEEYEQGVFGEIFISIPQCQRQADYMQHSIRTEVGILFVHGILHLFGYDHINNNDFKRMNKREEKIKKRLTESKIL